MILHHHTRRARKLPCCWHRMNNIDSSVRWYQYHCWHISLFSFSVMRPAPACPPVHTHTAKQSCHVTHDRARSRHFPGCKRRLFAAVGQAVVAQQRISHIVIQTFARRRAAAPPPPPPEERGTSPLARHYSRVSCARKSSIRRSTTRPPICFCCQ